MTRLVTPAGWSVLLGSAAVVRARRRRSATRRWSPSASAALLAFAVAVAAVLVRPRLRVERAVSPARVTVGEPATGQVRTCATSPAGRRPASSRSTGSAARPSSCRWPGCSPAGSRAVQYRVPTRRAGGCRSVRSPWSGATRSGCCARPQARVRGVLWVHPRVHPIAAAGRGGARLRGPVADTAPRGTVTFSSLREYVPGDDPRQIHWRSTARTGRLMVREHVDTSEPTVAVVLDTRADGVAGTAVRGRRRGGRVGGGRLGAARPPGRAAVLGEDRAAVARAGATGLLDRLAAGRRHRRPRTTRGAARPRRAGGARRGAGRGDREPGRRRWPGCPSSGAGSRRSWSCPSWTVSPAVPGAPACPCCARARQRMRWPPRNRWWPGART